MPIMYMFYDREYKVDATEGAFWAGNTSSCFDSIGPYILLSKVFTFRLLGLVPLSNTHFISIEQHVRSFRLFSVHFDFDSIHLCPNLS